MNLHQVTCLVRTCCRRKARTFAVHKAVTRAVWRALKKWSSACLLDSCIKITCSRNVHFFWQANLSVVNIQPSWAPATTPKLYILRRWQLVSKFVTSCMLLVTTTEGPEVFRGVMTRMCIQERKRMWCGCPTTPLVACYHEVHNCSILLSNGCSPPRRAHQPPSMMLYYHRSICTSMRTKNTSTITHRRTTGCKVESTFRPLGWILRISEMWLNEVGMLDYPSHCRAWPVGFAKLMALKTKLWTCATAPYETRWWSYTIWMI